MYSNENITAFNAVVDVLNKHRIAPGGVVPRSGATFEAGRIGLDWGAGSVLRDYVTTQLSFGLGVAVPPIVNFRASMLYNAPLFIASNTKYPDEAWELLKFCTGKEALIKRVEFTGVLSARRSAMPAFLDSIAPKLGLSANELAAFFTGMISSGWFGEEKVTGFAEIKNLIAEELTPMLRGEVAVEAALQQVHDKVNVYIGDLKKK